MHRSNGSNQRQTADRAARSAGARSRLAGRVDKVLNSILAGDHGASINAGAPELLAESEAVAAVIAGALDRPDTTLIGHWRVQEAFRESGLSEALFDALADPEPTTRAAAARLCGALRLTNTVSWIADLVQDESPGVRDAAIRSLGQVGGRRAVEALVGAEDAIPLYRLAITLSRAASDLDIEALMRQPRDETAAIVTVLAVGLRRDVLRVPPLLAIARDRRWPDRVRVAACKSVGMIGDVSATEALKRLADTDPAAEVKTAAERAGDRLSRGSEVGS